MEMKFFLPPLSLTRALQREKIQQPKEGKKHLLDLFLGKRTSKFL
jgi:hypothetical protein